MPKLNPQPASRKRQGYDKIPRPYCVSATGLANCGKKHRCQFNVKGSIGLLFEY